MPIIGWLVCMVTVVATDLGWKFLLTRSKGTGIPDATRRPRLAYSPTTENEEGEQVGTEPISDLSEVPPPIRKVTEGRDYQLGIIMEVEGVKGESGSKLFQGVGGDREGESEEEVTSQELIVVVTVDGSFHGLNRKTGELVWSQEVPVPLVEVYSGLVRRGGDLNKPRVVNKGEGGVKSGIGLRELEEDLLVPELGGSGKLYYVHQHGDNRKGLEPFPLTYKELVEATPVRYLDRLYLGEKSTSYLYLKVKSGQWGRKPFLPQPPSINGQGGERVKLQGVGDSEPEVLVGVVNYQLQVYEERSLTLIWSMVIREYQPDILPITQPHPPLLNETIPFDLFTLPVVYSFEVVKKVHSLLEGEEEEKGLVKREVYHTRTLSNSKIKSNQPHLALVGHHNGVNYILSTERYPYLNHSKFLPSHSGNSNPCPNPNSRSPTTNPISPYRTYLDEIEKLCLLTNLTPIVLTLKDSFLDSTREPLTAVRRWAWLSLATLLALGGFKEFQQLQQLYSSSFESIANPRQEEESNSNSPRYQFQFPKEPVKLKSLRNGQIVVGSITVSQVILGYGSHGTIVFKGFFQNREVAVKRMLIDLVSIAEQEVRTLEQSDDHPYVIRYYAMERCDQFLYLALELCPMTLQKYLETLPRHPTPLDLTPRDILYQFMLGLHHLHQLKIVHRDIKPQNILLGTTKDRFGQHLKYRVLISDFGLCKRLDEDESSFHNSHFFSASAGTMGWRAPECLMATTLPPYKLTRAVDIFSAGCLFFYVLTSGQHPFGDRFIREGRVIEGRSDLSLLLRSGDPPVKFGYEAHDLITTMLHPDPLLRPDCLTILIHPYFWDANKKLSFLQDVSDRLEAELKAGYRGLRLGLDIETGAEAVIGPSWLPRMDKRVLADLHKFRGYDGTRLRDLLRVIRNKRHHYPDLPPHVQLAYGPLPDGFLHYFFSRFPTLLLHVYRTLHLPHDPAFQTYFTLPPNSLYR